MPAWYNEIDPYAAQWLRNLIDAGHIAPGDVDERSIVDVRADDLAGYEQCHFFAGIGGWSLALRLAGWSDARPVWTGSCPCQPFSAAGQGKAADDERHLWPAWFSLIRELRPAVVFGEQVEAAIGWGWLDAVFADLEGEGYACGAAVLPACGVGAPHIRQRLWFVGHAARRDLRRDTTERPRSQAQGGREWAQAWHLSDDPGASGATGLMANADAPGRSLERGGGLLDGQRAAQRDDADRCGTGSMEHAGSIGRQRREAPGGGHEHDGPASEREQDQHGAGIAGSYWRCEWLPCTDGKARPVESGTFPLVAGLSFKLGSGSPLEGKSRVGMLRAYGNAIVPQTAAAFIKAAMDEVAELPMPGRKTG
jgi:DNA (cytosine-5)-methyltransferase 1